MILYKKNINNHKIEFPTKDGTVVATKVPIQHTKMFLKKKRAHKITTENPRENPLYYFFFNFFYEHPLTNFCTLISFFFQYVYSSHLKFLDELQTTSLKFGSVWILNPEISKFRFYHLNFESICILYLDISKFWFYHLKFRGVWINCLKFGGV